MKRMYIALLAMAFLPSAAFAARLQEYFIYAVDFFEYYLLPFLVALAVLFFFINIVRYFLLSGASEDGRTKARSLALWGILAFFLILSLWGIVRLVNYTFGIDNSNVICPEYVNCNPSSGARSNISPLNAIDAGDRDFYGKTHDTGSLTEQEIRDAGVWTEDALKHGFWDGAP